LIAFPFTVYIGWSVVDFEENWRWINFDSLKSKSDGLLQIDALLRSVCNFSVSSGYLITCRHFVSSANIKGMEHSGRSLIKTTNSRGPKTLHCGTPERTLHKFESESPILKRWYQYFKYASSRFSTFPVIPSTSSLLSRWLWDTESKAFLKSMYTTSTLHFDSRTLSAYVSSCWSVDLLGRKPNWCLEDLSLT